MPNQPRPSNPARPVRVEDDLWTAAGEACDELGTDRSTVMRDALRKVIDQAIVAGRGLSKRRSAHPGEP